MGEEGRERGQKHLTLPATLWRPPAGVFEKQQLLESRAWALLLFKYSPRSDGPSDRRALRSSGPQIVGSAERRGCGASGAREHQRRKIISPRSISMRKRPR